MKTSLISFAIAVLLGLAVVASGRAFDAADFIAIAFVTGLVAWTLVQYGTERRTTSTDRRIYLPINPSIPAEAASNIREAA